MNPECGGLYVRGCGEQGAAVEVRLGNENKNQTWFEIERISGSTGPQITLLVKDRTLEDLRNSPLNFLDKGNCSIEGYNITLPPSTPLMSFKKEFEHTLTLFFCNKSIHVTPSLFHNGNYYITDCVDDNHDYLLCYGVLMDDDVLPVAFNGCTITQLPAISTNVSDLESSYAAEFYLKVVLSEDCRKCFYEREGHCRVNDTGDFSCVFEGTCT
ncbi:hypothetical protein SESBI_31161 [Sesbania bispinosa]|nr:hypothetical protein SESBI_31161 [Sesbania bispinosa]